MRTLSRLRPVEFGGMTTSLFEMCITRGDSAARAFFQKSENLWVAGRAVEWLVLIQICLNSETEDIFTPCGAFLSGSTGKPGLPGLFQDADEFLLTSIRRSGY